jgi:DNA-binding NtrC family response regulator
MIHIMLVDGDRGELELLRSELELHQGLTTRVCKTGSEALISAGDLRTDVAVVGGELNDGDGLSFLKEFARVQPLINCALVSSLSPELFHEVTEGLGVFMQLPENSGAAEADKMLQLLESIEVLLTM